MKNIENETLKERFNLKDGTYIRYTVQGKGEPLLLLHTIRNRIEYSDKLIPFLTKKFKVYVIDLPGHGDSPINKDTNYDQQFITKQVVDFIEQQGLTNLTIAGESIGGVLPATIAKKIPDKIKKIFCFNPYDYDKRFADGASRGNFMALFLLFHMSLPFGLGVMFSKLEMTPTLWMIFRGGVYNKSAITKDYLTLLTRSIKRKGHTYHMRNIFLNYKSWGNHSELYDGLKAPVTLIYGETDWARDNDRNKTMKSLGLERYITMKNTGHFSFLESAKEVSDIILENQ